jgi:soluble epoxide hydrolase/lipid-phosphate phosphatase
MTSLLKTLIINRGCMVAYRFALEYPSFVTHMFTCAVPYYAPTEQFIPTEVVVKFLPSLGYQLQFGSKEGIIESATKDKAGIRNFLNALYSGRTTDGKEAGTAEKGFDLDLISSLERSAFVSEDELDYYVEEFARNGFSAPCKTPMEL